MSAQCCLMQYSRSAPALMTTFSCAFLSAMIDDITVIIRRRKDHGAWSIESPTPMEVTTEIRLTPLALHAAMMLAVPSCRQLWWSTSGSLSPLADQKPASTAWHVRSAVAEHAASSYSPAPPST